MTRLEQTFDNGVTQRVLPISTPGDRAGDQRVDGFDGSATDHGGYMDGHCEISLEEYEAHPNLYDFGTQITVRDLDDLLAGVPRIRWEGRLTDPVIGSESVGLPADGWGKKLEKMVMHFFAQEAGFAEWVLGNSAPHDYAVNDLIEAKIGGRKAHFRVRHGTVFRKPNGKAQLADDVAAGSRTFELNHNWGGLEPGDNITVGGENKVVANSYTEDSTYVEVTTDLNNHAEGTEVTWDVDANYAGWKTTILRYLEAEEFNSLALEWRATHKDDYVIEICDANGPKGALTVLHTIDCSEKSRGRLGHVAGALTGKDLVAIRVRRTSEVTKAEGWHLELWDARLNGLAEGDFMSTADGMRALADKTGCDPAGIDDTDTNMLPAAFIATRAADIADAIAILDDRPWGVYGGKEFIYRPRVARVWKLVDPNIDPNLEPGDRWTEVILPHRAAGGSVGYARYSVPDINGIAHELEVPFSNPLPSKETCDIVGPILAAALSEIQMYSEFETEWVEDVDDPGVPVPAQRMKPTDKIRVTFHGNHSLRLSEMHYVDDGAKVQTPAASTLLDQLNALRNLFIARGQNPDDATIDALSLGPPTKPTFPDALIFKRASKKHHHNEMNALLHVAHDEEDIRGRPTVLKRIHCELRPVDALGVPIPEALGGKVYQYDINRNKLEDLEPDNALTAIFRDIERPFLWDWQRRAEAIDLTGNGSGMTAWGGTSSPGAEHDPPSPTSGTLDIDPGRAHFGITLPADDEDPESPDQRIHRVFYKLKRPNGTVARRDHLTPSKTIEHTVKISQPGTGTWTLEVSTEDSEQRRSTPIVLTGNALKPPTPAAPSSVTFKRGGKKGIRAVVNGTLGGGIAFLDDDYDKIVLEYQAEDSNPTGSDEIFEKRKNITPSDASQPYSIGIEKLKAGEKFQVRAVVEDKSKRRSDPSGWLGPVTVAISRKPNKVSGRSIVSKTRGLKCKWTPPTTWSDGTSAGFSPSEIAYNVVTLRRAGADVETVRVGGGETDFCFFPMTKAEAALTGYSFSVTTYGWDEDFATPDAATGSATPEGLGVGSSDIDDGAITYPKFGSSVAGIVFTSSTTTPRTLDGRTTETLNTPPTHPTGGSFKAGDVCYNSADKKLYRFDGTWWRRAADGGDFTAGSIVADDVTAGTFRGLTFIGGVFKSAETGKRVEISNSASEEINWYNDLGNLGLRIYLDSSNISRFQATSKVRIACTSSAGEIVVGDSLDAVGFFDAAPVTKRADPGDLGNTSGTDIDGNARAKINDILAKFRQYGLF